MGRRTPGLTTAGTFIACHLTFLFSDHDMIHLLSGRNTILHGLGIEQASHGLREKLTLLPGMTTPSRPQWTSFLRGRIQGTYQHSLHPDRTTST